MKTLRRIAQALCNGIVSLMRHFKTSKLENCDSSSHEICRKLYSIGASGRYYFHASLNPLLNRLFCATTWAAKITCFHFPFFSSPVISSHPGDRCLSFRPIIYITTSLFIIDGIDFGTRRFKPFGMTEKPSGLEEFGD